MSSSKAGASWDRDLVVKRFRLRLCIVRKRPEHVERGDLVSKVSSRTQSESDNLRGLTTPVGMPTGSATNQNKQLSMIIQRLSTITKT